MKEYTKKCVSLRQNDQNVPKYCVLCAEEYTGLRKSTPLPVVAKISYMKTVCPGAKLLTNMSYGYIIYEKCAPRGEERLDGKLVVITGANCGIGLEVDFQFSLEL